MVPQAQHATDGFYKRGLKKGGWMKTYIGDRGRYGRTVVVRDGYGSMSRMYYLKEKPSQDLFNHSTDGFDWGYSGSGPAQLSLAILLDFMVDPVEALKLHQTFKELVVSRLDHGAWILTEGSIMTAIDGIKIGVGVPL